MSEKIKAQIAESLLIEARGNLSQNAKKALLDAAAYLKGDDTKDWEGAVACLRDMKFDLMASAVGGLDDDELLAAWALIEQIDAIVAEEQTKHNPHWSIGLFRH